MDRRPVMINIANKSYTSIFLPPAFWANTNEDELGELKKNCSFSGIFWVPSNRGFEFTILRIVNSKKKDTISLVGETFTIPKSLCKEIITINCLPDGRIEYFLDGRYITTKPLSSVQKDAFGD
jgi:hypothetical protein